MRLFRHLILLAVAAFLLAGCSVSQQMSEQQGADADIDVLEETSEVVEEQPEGVPLKETCAQVAREFQTYFQSDSSFADASQSLALGLSIAASDAQSRLASNLNTYIDLMLKVDSSVRTNADFQALVEQKHVTARDAVFAICESEGIRIN